jgi:hypothetical protein
MGDGYREHATLQRDDILSFGGGCVATCPTGFAPDATGGTGSNLGIERRREFQGLAASDGFSCSQAIERQHEGTLRGLPDAALAQELAVGRGIDAARTGPALEFRFRMVLAGRDTQKNDR